MDIIIIGATSNICKIRVFENLNKIYQKINTIWCVSSKNISLEEWRGYITSLNIKDNQILEKIHYKQCHYNLSDYKKKISELVSKYTIVYVSTPPCCYKDCITFINEIKRGTLYLEKPLSLNKEDFMTIKPIFSERVKLIDHFLFKTDIQKLISNHHERIENIHFRFLYNDDVESRLGYFDQTGFFIDMFQSHFLSILYCLDKELVYSLKDGLIQIERKQYRDYGGANKDIDTYFYLIIKVDNRVVIFEAGKAMKDLSKQIIINNQIHEIRDYHNEYSIFFSQINDCPDLLSKQEVFWNICDTIKGFYKDIEYYDKNDFSGSLLSEEEIFLMF